MMAYMSLDLNMLSNNFVMNLILKSDKHICTMNHYFSNLSQVQV